MRIRALLSAFVIVISAGWFACMDHNLAPVIQIIETQQILAKSSFILDLADYVADDKDATEDLVFAKSTNDNGGQFLGSLYINTYSVTGMYTVGFLVVDSNDKTSSGSFDIKVINPQVENDPPVIAAIPQQVAQTYTPMTLNVTQWVSDDSDAVEELAFSVLRGGGEFTGSQYDNEFISPGSKTVYFLAMDSDGMVAVGNFTVSVTGRDNTAPAIGAMGTFETGIQIPFLLNLGDYVTDDHDQASNLSYDLVDGPGILTGNVYQNMFASGGLSTIYFEVTDLDGLTNGATFYVDVKLAPQAAFDVNVTGGSIPLVVYFFDHSIGSVSQWEWDFDSDGIIDSTMQNPQWTYSVPGKYSVILRVTGSGGISSVQQHNLIDAMADWNCVQVPSGWFEMGRRMDESGNSNELPRHFVYLDEYYIGKYEVTNQQYVDVLNWALGQGDLKNSSNGSYDGGDVYTSSQKLLSITYSYCQISYSGVSFWAEERDGYSMNDHPVVEVSWSGSVAYCNWRSEKEGYTPCYNLSTWELTVPYPNGYRLPTEAEWERAASWDTARNDVTLPDLTKGGHWIYGFGSDSISISRANCYDEGYANPLGLTDRPYTSPVGYYDGSNSTIDSPSPVGCYDMSGNVFDWCHDWYGSYPSTNQTNPTGPSASYRVLRSGGWNSGAYGCRGAYRSVDWPYSTGNSIGFRLARTN